MRNPQLRFFGCWFFFLCICWGDSLLYLVITRLHHSILFSKEKLLQGIQWAARTVPEPSGDTRDRPLLPKHHRPTGSLCLDSLLSGQEHLKAAPNSQALPPQPFLISQMTDQHLSLKAVFSPALPFYFSTMNHLHVQSHLLFKDSDGFTTLEHLNLSKRRGKCHFCFCKEKRGEEKVYKTSTKCQELL